MTKITFLFLLILSSIFFACSVQRQSKFTSGNIKLGMTKEAAIAKYGQPYKESSSTDGEQNLLENLYYKEEVYLGRWYEVNSVLHFENSLFKSLEHGKEKLLYNESKVIVK